MEETETDALIYANTHRFSHDISHCNPEEVDIKCGSCKRYAAHLQVYYNQDKFAGNRFAYLSHPKEECMNNNYEYFLTLN